VSDTHQFRVAFVFQCRAHRYIQDTVFRVSRLHNPFSTCILLYTRFTFDTPEYCSYIHYKINFLSRVSVHAPRATTIITALYKIDSRVSRLHNFLLTGTLLYTGFPFDLPERPSYIILYYTSFDSSILPTFFRNLYTTQVRRPNQSSFLVLYDTCSLFLH
jgi:hypothetical protein